MTDLATLGVRIESHEAEIAEDRLDGMAMAADRAEKQTDQLADAARRGTTSVSTMNAALRQQQLVHRAAQVQMGLTRYEALNLGRQFADVGVSIASGAPLYLIAIQQGAQIGEVFAEARSRGVGMSQAMGGIARQAGALVARLGPLALLAGGVGAAFALMARDMNKAGGEIVDDLGLTVEQLERLRESGESTAITLGDAWRGFGTTVKEVLQEAFGEELAAAGEAWNSFLDRAAEIAGQATTFILERFLGAYYGLKAAWSGLPAAIGDAAVSAANIAVNAIEWMLNKAIEGINNIIPLLNLLRRASPGGFSVPDIEQVGEVDFGGLDNPYAGRFAGWSDDIAAGRQHGIALAQAMADGFEERWRANTEASREARLRAAAGEPQEQRDRAGRGGGLTDQEREDRRTLAEAQRLLQQLREDTAEIGLNEIERRIRAIGAAAAEVAPLNAELAIQIREAGEAWRVRTEAFELEQEIESIRQMTAALTDEAEVLALERDLIGATNEERERQLAMLRAEIDLRRQAEEFYRRTGIRRDFVNTPDGQRFIEQAGQNAIDAAALADMRSLHDALASTFESAFRQAMKGDWRGILETVLSAILDRMLARMANDLAAMFSRQGGGGEGQSGIGAIISAGLSLFGTGGPAAVLSRPGSSFTGPVPWTPPSLPSFTGLGASSVPIRITFEATEGKMFGARILDIVSPAMAQVGTAAAKGGAELALRTASRANRNRLGVG